MEWRGCHQLGTSVGSKAVTLTKAILIAAIFEVLGSLFAGGRITDTIRGEIINANLFSQTPQLLVFGMLASLLAAGTWLIVDTHLDAPSQQLIIFIVRAIIGFGLTVLSELMPSIGMR